MDKLAELSHGAKVVLGAAVALLVVSFFNWFQYDDVGCRDHVERNRSPCRPSVDRADRLAGDCDS